MEKRGSKYLRYAIFNATKYVCHWDPTFAAYLAKKALLRDVDQSNPDPFYASLEQELLGLINGLGIGPQGFGGKTTALAVNIETYPTHIAGLPVAVNINCHVTRHKTEVL